MDSPECGAAFYLTSPEIEKGSIHIHELEGPVKGGEIVNLTKDTLRFVADGSRAGDLFCFAEIANLINQGKNVGIVFNEADTDEIMGGGVNG